MIQKHNNRGLILCGSLLVVGILAYSSVYLTNVYPFTEGWGIYYVELMNRGQVPYRDFYYYLPPLNLVIEWVFWKLSFGSLFLFRLWYVVQRIVMSLLLYKLLTKWFAPCFAWIACLVGTILRTAVVWDLGGDYNQTQTLFALILIYMVVWFLEKDANSPVKSIFRYKYIFFAGMVIALMVLLKQSAGLAALLVCLVFLICYCICFRDKHFIQYCIATAAGAAIPLCICVAILAANGAFIPFLEQFFGVAGAKGGIGTILFAGWKTIFTNWKNILIFLTGLLALWSLVLCAKKKHSAAIFAVHLLVFLLAVYMGYGSAVKQTLSVICTSKTMLLIFAVVAAASIALAWKQDCSILYPFASRNYLGFTALLYLAVCVIIFINPWDIVISLYKSTSLFSDVPSIISYCSLFTAFICIAAQFFSYAKDRTALYPVAMTFVFAGGIADAYANLMNASSTVYPITAFILGPMLIVMLFSLDIQKWTRIKNLILCVLCVAVCGICMTQKYTTAYSWWGSEVTYSMDERSETTELEALKGFRLSEQRKTEFEEITKIIESNRDKNSTVWGYPHIKIFNILTDCYDVDDPVPVLFYDVCSDEAAYTEAEWLEENYPSFVIWCDMPSCIELHEQLYRNGNPLGQREIISWFSKVKDTAYVKVGQVGNLFVYQLNDLPRNYTYFQNPDAINITAGEVYETETEEESEEILDQTNESEPTSEEETTE